MDTSPNFGGYDVNAGGFSNGAGGVLVRFYTRSVQDKPASDAAGRAIFQDVVYIQKQTPGDKYNQIDRPVRDEDIRDYGPLYDAFKRSLTEKHEGTPLDQWPQITRAQVDNLRHLGVFTVEELVKMDNAKCEATSNVEVREKARDFLKRSALDADRAATQRQLAEKDQRLVELERKLAEAEARATGAGHAEDSKKKGGK